MNACMHALSRSGGIVSVLYYHSGARRCGVNLCMLHAWAVWSSTTEECLKWILLSSGHISLGNFDSQCRAIFVGHYVSQCNLLSFKCGRWPLQAANQASGSIVLLLQLYLLVIASVKDCLRDKMQLLKRELSPKDSWVLWEAVPVQCSRHMHGQDGGGNRSIAAYFTRSVEARLRQT